MYVLMYLILVGVMYLLPMYLSLRPLKVHPEKRDLGTTLKTGLRYISDLSLA